MLNGRNLIGSMRDEMIVYLPLPVSLLVLQVRTSVHLVPLQRFQLGSAVTTPSLLIFDILHIHSFLLVHSASPRMVIRTSPYSVSQSLSLETRVNIVRLAGNVGNIPGKGTIFHVPFVELPISSRRIRAPRLFPSIPRY